MSSRIFQNKAIPDITLDLFFFLILLDQKSANSWNICQCFRIRTVLISNLILSYQIINPRPSFL